MNVNKLVRDCVKNFQPYIPGKSIESLKRELNLKRIIKLASNENPLGPSRKAIQAIKKGAPSVFLYPDGYGSSLRRVLAKKHGVPVSNVFLGSGTDEIIEIIGKTFFKRSDNIIVSRHAFVRYKMAGELMGIKVKEIPMHHYTHDVFAMGKAIDSKTKAVFIANPNNPTGTYVKKDTIDAFLRSISRQILIVLDEAYFEYASLEKNYPDGISFFKKGFNNLIILRTFSKIYGLAGLRVGYCIGNASVIEVMDRIRPPFNMTRLSLNAAEACLSDKHIIHKSQRMAFDGKKRLCSDLKKLNLEHLPSAGNFVLLKVPGGGRNMFNRLLKKGVIVRAMDEYELPDFIRVTIGTPTEMKIFINALRKIINA